MKIKFKLPILTVLIAIIPILIISTISYTTIMRFSEENYTRIILNQSQASLKHIQDFYSTQVSIAEYTVDLEETISFIEAYENNSPDIQELTVQINLSQKLAEETNPYLNSSTILNRNGFVIASSDAELLGRDFSDTAIFKKVSNGKTASDVIHDNENSKDILLGVPILDSSDNVIGILQRIINLKYLNAYIQDLKIGDTGYMYIIDQHGDTLSHYYSDRVSAREEDYDGLAPLFEIVSNSILGKLQNQSDFFDYTFKGAPIKAYYTIEPNTNWVIIVAIPYNEISEVAKTSTNSIFMLTLIILTLAGTIGLLISRSIVNPLTKFQNKIELIAQGKFDERCTYDKNDEFGILAQNINKMTESLQANEKALISLALEDELTRMPNRKSIYLTMNNHFNKKPNQSIILLDLDGFKDVNDSLGHDFGDKVLIEVANILKQQENDFIYPARLGGDEFLVFVNNYNHSDEVTTLAKTILAQINSITQIHNKTISISASLGISFKTNEQNYNQLIKKSDLAMYQVKESGKSGIKIYQDSQEE